MAAAPASLGDFPPFPTGNYSIPEVYISSLFVDEPRLMNGFFSDFSVNSSNITWSDNATEALPAPDNNNRTALRRPRPSDETLSNEVQITLYSVVFVLGRLWLSSGYILVKFWVGYG